MALEGIRKAVFRWILRQNPHSFSGTFIQRAGKKILPYAASLPDRLAASLVCRRIEKIQKDQISLAGFGSDQARFEAFLKYLYPQVSVTATDIGENFETLEKAQKRFPDIRIAQADLLKKEDIQALGHIDVAFAITVMHHLCQEGVYSIAQGKDRVRQALRNLSSISDYIVIADSPILERQTAMIEVELKTSFAHETFQKIINTLPMGEQFSWTRKASNLIEIPRFIFSELCVQLRVGRSPYESCHVYFSPLEMRTEAEELGYRANIYLSGTRGGSAEKHINFDRNIKMPMFMIAELER